MKYIVSLQTFALALLFAASAFAQQGQAATRSLAGQETSLPGGTLALIAYFVLWVLIFGLIVVTMRRQRKVDREIDELERRMDEVFENVGD